LETQPLFVSAGEARREPLIEGCSWEQRGLRVTFAGTSN